MMKLLIVTVFLSSCAAITLKFSDCGSKGGTIKSVSAALCTEDPCVLHHGSNYTIQVDFTPSENSATAKTVVHGIIGGIPVPFPVPSDCCNDKNLKCPIVSGQEQIYTNNIYCSPDYPKIKLVAKWEVLDDKEQDLFCFAIPLEIQD